MEKYGVVRFLPGDRVIDSKLGKGIVSSVSEDDGTVYAEFPDADEGGCSIGIYKYSPDGRCLGVGGGQLCQETE